MWEAWYYEDNFLSHNHAMFASVTAWFFEYPNFSVKILQFLLLPRKSLGGISGSENSIAFDQILIQPQVVGDLRWVNASYDSVRGLISSQWKITNSVSAKRTICIVVASLIKSIRHCAYK